MANRSTGNSEGIAMINKELNTLKVIIITSTFINTLNVVTIVMLLYISIILAQ